MSKTNDGGRKSAPARDVDDYLARVPEDARAALEKLRKAIKAAAPKATEAISYQVPMFKHQGRPLVGFGAAKSHCVFYVMSPTSWTHTKRSARSTTPERARFASRPMDRSPRRS
jgi:hypothetical protein